MQPATILQLLKEGRPEEVDKQTSFSELTFTAKSPPHSFQRMCSCFLLNPMLDCPSISTSFESENMILKIALIVARVGQEIGKMALGD